MRTSGSDLPGFFYGLQWATMKCEMGRNRTKKAEEF
jgi:hypothetical protein